MFSVHGNGEVVFASAVEPLSHHDVVTYPTLLTCLFREEFIADHLGRHILGLLRTARSKVKTTSLSKWEKNSKCCGESLLTLVGIETF